MEDPSMSMDPEEAFLASKQVTGNEWELYKENVRPLKRGRNVQLLNQALRSQQDHALKKSLLQTRRSLSFPLSSRWYRGVFLKIFGLIPLLCWGQEYDPSYRGVQGGGSSSAMARVSDSLLLDIRDSDLSTFCCVICCLVDWNIPNVALIKMVFSNRFFWWIIVMNDIRKKLCLFFLWIYIVPGVRRFDWSRWSEVVISLTKICRLWRRLSESGSISDP